MRCPTCGAELDVPRLRDLAAYACGEPPRTERNWRACHGFLLVGSSVAALAAVAAATVSRFDGGASTRLPDEAVIRSVVEAADAATIDAAWKAISQSGVDRGAMPAELEVQRAVGSLRRIAALLWGSAAVGVVAAIGGGLACLAGRSGTTG